MDRDGFQPLAAPYRTEASLGKGAVVAGGDGGNAHQMFAGWTDDHAFILMAAFVLKGLLGLMDAHTPQVVSGQNFDFVVLNFNIYVFLRLTLNDKPVVTGIFQFRSKPAADVAKGKLLRQHAGADGTGGAAASGRDTGAGGGTVHINKLVPFVKSAGTRSHFIPEDTVDQHAPAHIFGHILISAQSGNLSGGQVDAGDFAAVAINRSVSETTLNASGFSSRSAIL